MPKCAFEVVMFDFMKTIHVKLSDETIDFIVTEEAWEYNLLKFLCIFDDELKSIGRPVDNLLILFHLNYLKKYL